MDAITAITTRVSATVLAEPGPTPEQLRTILSAGVCAPDHGRLAPWRFVVLAGADREILARAMIKMRLRSSPGVSRAEAEKDGLKAMRAPTIVVVAARIDTPSKVPSIERVIAVGAATQNMFLAAHALGLGAMWKTGEAAYDEKVKVALGLAADDHVVAFLHLGTAVSLGKPRVGKIEDHILTPFVAGTER